MAERINYKVVANLAERLVRDGLLKPEELRKAKEAQAKTGEPLGTVLVKSGILAEEKLLTFLGRQLNIPQVSLKDYLIEPEIIKLVPERVVRQHRVMPLFRIGDVLTVAMADPLNILALDDIQAHSKCEVETVISGESDIQEAIAQHYGTAQSLVEIVESIQSHPADFLTVQEGQPQRIHRMAAEPPVVRLVNMVLINAIGDRASDVHIEPTEDDLKIRFRVDGALKEYTRLPRNLQLSVVSRVKIMSGIDISERRLPQDGRIELKAGDRLVDLRVATYPSIHGEKIAIRILDKATGIRNLNDIGFSEKLLGLVRGLIDNPFGLTLVVGPTGSGKTTTLYSILREVRSEEKNTMTIEDPVEYRIDGLSQAQVNPKIGLTFAEGLRGIVRQDPDVIMIGEVRDLETAEIAVRAALTGHQVFSTLHTNDAASTVTRLNDMGLDSYLIASSLTSVIAQRLVRRICMNCREGYKPAEKILEQLRFRPEGEVTFYRGKGCKQCGGTGYLGRMGLFEMMEMNHGIQDLIMLRKPTEAIQALAREGGMQNLREYGMDQVLAGQTTFDEVLRVTFGSATQ